MKKLLDKTIIFLMELVILKKLRRVATTVKDATVKVWKDFIDKLPKE